MSSTETNQETEPPVKKQRIDSGEDQDVGMARETMQDRASTTCSIIASEGEKAISSPSIQASYSFTIANDHLISKHTLDLDPKTASCCLISKHVYVSGQASQLLSSSSSQGGVCGVPKAPHIQLSNPTVQNVRPPWNSLAVHANQITSASNVAGIRPAVTMASVIRPTLQLQAVTSGCPTKVISASPTQIRVPMQVSQSSMTIPVQSPQGQGRSHVQIGGLQIPFQQAWTVDRKMTFQIANNTVRPVNPKVNTAIPQATTLPMQQNLQKQTNIPTIALHKSGHVSMLQKPTLAKIPSAGDANLVKIQPPSQTDQPQVISPQPQISFQVPLNWSGTGSNKSLLDSGKVSVLANPGNAQSIIKPALTSSSGMETVSNTAACEVSHVTTVSSQSSTVTTAAINSSGVSNLPGGIPLSQLQKPATTVTIANIPKITAAKGGSFVFSAGNKVAFVPSSQVVTQIVKTDSKSIGKVTMAEAQIMLPSGPAKISWPVPPQTKTEGKHILLTKPSLQSGSPTGKGKPGDISGVLKPGTVSASLVASSKIVTDGASHSKLLVHNNSASPRPGPPKNLILKTQRSWELVKQASLLMPKKNVPTANVELKLQTPGNTVEDEKTKLETEISAERNQIQADSQKSAEKEKAECLENSNAEDKEALNEDKCNLNKVNGDEDKDKISEKGRVTKDELYATVEPISPDISTEQESKIENNNNEIHKNEVAESSIVETNKSKIESEGTALDTREVDNENIETAQDSDTLQSVIGSEPSAKSETVQKVAEPDSKVTKVQEENSSVKLEPLHMDENYEPMVTEDTSTSEMAQSVDGKKNTGSEDAGDFDAVGAMEWKDGVGELPGSDLKFRMNDLGVLEVITDDLLCNETLNTSDELEESGKDKEDVKVKTEPETVAIKEEPLPEPPPISNEDKISQCENCLEYDFVTNFYKDGRFCSQTCMGAFDSKRMREVKRHGAMSRVVLGLKNKRKKLLFKSGVNGNTEIKKEPGLQVGKKSKAFIWSKYLEDENAIDTPPKLFKNPFPSARNNFRVGMKLEGVDSCHQALFCVLTVAELCGYRIRLHFDGYSECYDFWTDIDSPYIFPVGFCEKNGKILQPPKGFTVDDFVWSHYLKLTRATAAPKSLFTNQPVQSVTPQAFRVGCKLEAVDKKNSSLICVATVGDTMGNKLLIHFDGWDNNYDYWCDVTSPFIHPIGYCDMNGYVLSPPCNYSGGEFSWDAYLAETKSSAVPARAFKPKAPVAFEPGMKVEVIDKRNPVLVRVATIIEIENHMVKIHFDGWLDIYDYWLDDDSSDLHPPGWCAKTGHPLVPPIYASDLVVSSGPGICPTPGCKGIGHIKGPKFNGHHSTFGCPYSEININKESVLGDRLGGISREESGAPPTVIKPPEQAAEITLKRCTTDGCDGSGHVTGKFPYHSKPSGCPKLHHPKEKKDPRGRKPKGYYLQLAEEEAKHARETEEKEHLFRQGIHNSVFMSSMITTPRNDQPLCWDQHSKLLPGVSSMSGNDVTKWGTEEVESFIKTLPGCEEHAKTFVEEQIDGEAFLLLTQSDIVKILNIKLGPALKIFNSIIMFKNTMEV